MTAARYSALSGGREIRLGSMILLSVAAHLLVLTSGAFLKLSTTPRMTFGPVYSVQLVNLPPGMTAPKTTSSLSRELLQPDAAQRSVILRKEEERRAAPLRRSEPAASRNLEVEKALEAMRKRTADTAASPAKTPPAATAPEGPVSGGQGASSRFNEYYSVIWARIKGQWAFPGGILPKGGLESVIHARILRTGAITDIYIEKRSGNAYFDNSALRAVNKANPLPPLPDWYSGGSLEVGIRFHSSALP